jgi:diacylglycerol kinase (ATP)
VGLLSALFPAADDIQHGNLARVGDFLATLVASPPAEMHLILDNKQEILTQCHVVLVSNMPYIGPHYKVGNSAAMNDGLLDVLIFADLSKMDLLGNIVALARGGAEDERIQHYHVRRVEVHTNPALPVMADGLASGVGSLLISVQPKALAVISC